MTTNRLFTTCGPECESALARRRHNARRRVGPRKGTCEACGETFVSKRIDARTCSDRCRQRLSRAGQ